MINIECEVRWLVFVIQWIKILNFYSRPGEFLGYGISPAPCISLHKETQKENGRAGTSTIKTKFAASVPVLCEARTYIILCVFLLRRYRQVWRNWASKWRLYVHQRSFPKIGAFCSATVNSTRSALLYHKICDKNRDNEKNQFVIA